MGGGVAEMESGGSTMSAHGIWRPRAARRAGGTRAKRPSGGVAAERRKESNLEQLLAPAEAASIPEIIRLPPVTRLEPFVDAKVVADFLALRRAEVLKLTREGKIRGYAYRGQQRRVYRYRLSEVSQDFEALGHATIAAAAPVSQRRRSNG